MGSNKPKRPMASSPKSRLATTLCFVMVLVTIPAVLILLHNPNYSICPDDSSTQKSSWSGDLRLAEFAWNRLSFDHENPPPTPLKIAVFTRIWPTSSVPGGMERHAYTLHTRLAQRGHEIHVFTSPPNDDHAKKPRKVGLKKNANTPMAPLTIHWHDGESGKWRYNKAWEQYEEENKHRPFDAIHSESVALPFHVARSVSNLVVSWHGIALESLQSRIYQDLAIKSNQNQQNEIRFQGLIPKVLDEIRFFQDYAHHVAISDSCGEMLRDVYQIPSKRVHVIVNGVNEDDFQEDSQLGTEFRSKIGVPRNASLVLGVAGRLVKDKGHPLLYEAFSKFMEKNTTTNNVYLVVVGSGPWLQRYRDLGPQVIALGSMDPSELRAFYNAIDIFVNPTLRPQGLDLTLMEAMMSGKPVMASRFPSIKGTIVVKDEFGFMFSPNAESLLEALELVVAEGSKRLAQRGRACKDYASSMFTANKMALAYERLFLCIKNQTFCNYYS